MILSRLLHRKLRRFACARHPLFMNSNFWENVLATDAEARATLSEEGRNWELSINNHLPPSLIGCAGPGVCFTVCVDSRSDRETRYGRARDNYSLPKLLGGLSRTEVAANIHTCKAQFGPRVKAQSSSLSVCMSPSPLAPLLHTPRWMCALCESCQLGVRLKCVSFFLLRDFQAEFVFD